ncbi:MAG: phenylalanine--tRNA ligase subunit alpha [Promethearchaeota archaeon]
MPISLKTEYIPVLKKLQDLNKSIEARDLSDLMKIGYEKLMSGAIFNLQELGLAKFTEKDVMYLHLNKEGKQYLEKGIPARQIFNLFIKNGRKEALVSNFSKEVEKELGFTKKLFFIGFTNMKKNKWVVTSKASGQEQLFIYNESPKKLPLEKLLELFKNHKEGLISDNIPKVLQVAIQDLTRRKLIQRDRKTLRTIELTSKGKTISDKDIQPIDEEIQLITSDMIKSGEWKESLGKLKQYDVKIDGPRIPSGKMHPITIIKNDIRKIFHSMGFQEIRGPIIETAFYNFDCLYQPQDHPAREMHDTFYLKNPATGDLPPKKIIDKIKAIHENGGDSGSTGWNYSWSSEIAKKTLLRTHTTATTLRNLSRFVNEKAELPIKLFCVDRVFRNEKVDRTHLAEFEQIEGIIIGKNVTLCDLIGQITEFYKQMGFKKIVTRPGFFPYTEPSMEIAVYSEELGAWLEMGGSGIFRPEVTSAWGIKDPVRVLAWGMGMERLAMLKLKRNDIRDLYQSPIEWLREVSY